MKERAFNGFFRAFFGVAAMTILAACSSVQGGAGLPATQATSPPQHVRKAKATIRITIPKRKLRVRVRKHYVSASTQAITIAVTPKGAEQRRILMPT
jgi:hypothetical protein